MDNDIVNYDPVFAEENICKVFNDDKTDREIIRLFMERNEGAISAAERKYGKYCTAIAMNILKDPQEAEECLNDTLLKVWENIPPSDPDNLPGFLAKITKNLCINRYNKLHAAKRGSGEITFLWDELSECVPNSQSIERQYEQKELLNEINAFLTKLPRNKRDLFILRYWYCMSLSELSQRTGTTENHAAVTLSRIRKKLLNYLRKRGF